MHTHHFVTRMHKRKRRDQALLGSKLKEDE
jgi:hypothetical protein